jgi:hypothetical protein
MLQPSKGSLAMLADSLALMVAYIMFGFVTCFLARKGRPDDWDETLLASILGPPLFGLIAALVAASFVWARLQPTPDDSKPRSSLRLRW